MFGSVKSVEIRLKAVCCICGGLHCEHLVVQASKPLPASAKQGSGFVEDVPAYQRFPYSSDRWYLEALGYGLAFGKNYPHHLISFDELIEKVNKDDK